MTEPDPRDEACAKEAWGVETSHFTHIMPYLELEKSVHRALILAAKLAREGWESVDPLLMKAREIAAEGARQSGCDESYACYLLSGDADKTWGVKASLLALREGIRMKESGDV